MSPVRNVVARPAPQSSGLVPRGRLTIYAQDRSEALVFSLRRA